MVNKDYHIITRSGIQESFLLGNDAVTYRMTVFFLSLSYCRSQNFFVIVGFFSIPISISLRLCLTNFNKKISRLAWSVSFCADSYALLKWR